MRGVLVLCLLALSCAAPRATAQSAEPIAEIREVWASCSALLEGNDWKRDEWTGWRRSVDGGYGDFFEFWNFAGDGVSVLKETFFIDAIAVERQTSCFRKNGSLAFVLIAMTSPRLTFSETEGREDMLTREGRIYVAPSADVVRVTGQIVQADKRVADIHDQNFLLMRPCQPLDLHLTVDRVRAHQLSVQGDIYGDRPTYEPNKFDWCAVAKPQ